MGDTAWSEYYFAKNLQGDVVGVYRASDNAQVAFYEYDAWGNILYKYGEMADINPFRYRTYYYDNETWFYYLQSRYYDPAIGRFINTDAYTSTGQGLLGNNMFAYCGNNPVNRVDPNGKLWGIVGLVAVCLGVILACTSSENQVPTYRQNAQNKYNDSNVKVYERDNPPIEKGDINAEIYYPENSKSNINISNSLDITSGYEQDAILDVIIASPYYSEDIYGSKSFMKAQRVAHNVSYSIASSGDLGFWIMQHLSGSDNPIISSSSLDLRSMNNLLKRQRMLYTVISWVC